MTTIETRIARDLESILDLAEKNGTLGRLKSVAIYLDEMELRAIVKSMRQVIPDPAQTVSEPVGKYEIACAVHEGRYNHDYPPELVTGFDEERSPGREYCFRIATNIMDKFDVVRKGAPVQSCSAESGGLRLQCLRCGTVDAFGPVSEGK